ncbi:MAG: hypothetical protein ACOX2P_07075 [Bacillota bacterium]|jgi:serine protease AprX
MNEGRYDIIKLGLRDSDVKKNKDGGGDPKYFGDCGNELREFLRARIKELEQNFRKDFTAYPDMPAVGKVRLKKEALAKSHRPNRIFNEKTCPIIGVDHFGELLIKVTPDRLNNLDRVIKETTSTRAEANITAIEDIVPNTISDVLAGVNLETMKKRYRENPNEPIKIQLFDYKDVQTNRKNKEIFNNLVTQIRAEILDTIRYSDTLISYKVRISEESALEVLATYIGVRKLAFFPRYKVEPPRKNPFLQSIDISKLFQS